MREYPVKLVRKGNQVCFEERKLDRSRYDKVAGYLGWLREHYPEDYDVMVTVANNGDSLVYPEA